MLYSVWNERIILLREDPRLQKNRGSCSNTKRESFFFTPHLSFFHRLIDKLIEQTLHLANWNTVLPFTLNRLAISQEELSKMLYRCCQSLSSNIHFSSHHWDEDESWDGNHSPKRFTSQPKSKIEISRSVSIKRDSVIVQLRHSLLS